MKFTTTLALFCFSTLLPAAVGIKKVADGLKLPVWAGDPGTKKDTMWVIEQHGAVHEVNTATGEKNELFDISARVSRKGSEEGLLGLAFAPDFAKTGRFYINYTNKEHFTCISRMVASKDGISIDDEEVVLQYKQDFQNHNGGWIGFGPDGMLYIGNGDGGAGNDPKKRAQDLQSLLGKILRIDVSPTKRYTVPADNPFVKNKNAKPEIWAYGLRNPWRCSFDLKNDEFWIADVGQNKVEEINVISRKKSAGANFGWRLREGDIATPADNVGGDKPKGAVEPIYTYLHGGGKNQGFSVTGGYVYRGKAISEWQGRYIFADYANPRIWSLVMKGSKAADFQDHTDELKSKEDRIKKVSSFAEDRNGEIYVVDHAGQIYQIISR